MKLYRCEMRSNDNLKQTKKEDKTSIQFKILTEAQDLPAQSPAPLRVSRSLSITQHSTGY